MDRFTTLILRKTPEWWMPCRSFSLRKSSGFNCWSMGVHMVKDPSLSQIERPVQAEAVLQGDDGIAVSCVCVCVYEVWEVIAEEPPGLSNERNTCVSETNSFLPDPVFSCCCLKLNTPNQHCMHYMLSTALSAAWSSHFTRNMRKHPDSPCWMEMDIVL